MRTSRGSFKLLLLTAMCAASPLQAKVVEAKIAKVVTGAGTLSAVRISLDWPDGAATGTLRLRAEALAFPAMSYRAKAIDWSCPLVRAPAGAWQCAGAVSVAGSGRHRLVVKFAPAETSASLAVGASRIDYRSRAALPDRSSVQLHKVPVAWMQAFLAGLWQEGRWTAGQLDGGVEVLTPADGAFKVKTDLQLSGIGLETPDGLLAAADLKGRLRVDYSERGRAQAVDARLTATGGELLFNSLYLQFPASAVEARVQARRTGEAAWQLPVIQWRDPGVLSAGGKASLATDASVDALDLTLAFTDLGKARDRYLSGFLAPAGFSDLGLDGKLDATVRLRKGVPLSLEASLEQVGAIDPRERFAFAGLDGDLRWTRGEAAVDSRLGWRSGALFGIPLGPADFLLRSAGGELRLGQPVAIPVLQGQLRVNHLRWRAPAAEQGASVVFGLAMEDLDLGALSKRLDWPAFTGSISGTIPSATLVGDMLTTDGGLQMKLFGGSVELQNLAMERPFGTAPTLSADVKVRDLDLEAMTRVFDFGTITGRLDGRIDALRLVDWAPVAFDARFETDKDWDGKRRISQRAVRNISDVGGGGVAGGLQGRVLKVFDDFSYDRIGLACVLKDNVCSMDGVGSAGEGYIIVAGAGLPRIQVVGFRRQVDWPTLVSRLQAATSGQAAPVIQ